MILICSHTPDRAISPPDTYRLSVNPSVDTTQGAKPADLAEALENFLSTKNKTLSTTPTGWLKILKNTPTLLRYFSNWKRESGPNTYLPTLLAILPF
jgi:hypothetical protein